MDRLEKSLECVNGARSPLGRHLEPYVGAGFSQPGVEPACGQSVAVEIRLAPGQDFREPTHGQQILGRSAPYSFELALRLVQAAEIDERPTKRDTRREIAWVNGESSATSADRLFETSGLPVFFGQLREHQ